MRLKTDWHIHTRHSPCGWGEASLARLAADASAAGLTAIGVTDHLHCAMNEPTLRACRSEYDSLRCDMEVHFGVEVTAIRKWDLERNDSLGMDGNISGFHTGGPADGELTIHLPNAFRNELKIEYVIGGTHNTLDAPMRRGAIIRCFHRQNMFLACREEVDIVAHPWWWVHGWKNADGTFTGEPWFDDFRAIPRSMHDEFASAVLENDKAVEINGGAIFLTPRYTEHFKMQYLDYLLGLKAAGVRFAVNTDAHCPGYPAERVERFIPYLEKLDLDPDSLWRPGGTKESANKTGTHYDQ